jgi:hypothetical protein
MRDTSQDTITGFWDMNEPTTMCGDISAEN